MKPDTGIQHEYTAGRSRRPSQTSQCSLIGLFCMTVTGHTVMQLLMCRITPLSHTCSLLTVIWACVPCVVLQGLQQCCASPLLSRKLYFDRPSLPKTCTMLRAIFGVRWDPSDAMSVFHACVRLVVGPRTLNLCISLLAMLRDAPFTSACGSLLETWVTSKQKLTSADRSRLKQCHIAGQRWRQS
jgi:hypothetical protein